MKKNQEDRSGISRAYYAAYQAATALLLYARQIPPGAQNEAADAVAEAKDEAEQQKTLTELRAARQEEVQAEKDDAEIYRLNAAA